MTLHSFQWPEADQTMWSRVTLPASLLDDHGGLSQLRGSSRAMLRDNYGQWLKWLHRKEPTSLSEAPEDRATIDRLRRWLDDLTSVRPMTRLSYVSGTLRVLFEAAPSRDWNAQKLILAGLRRASKTVDPGRKAGRIFDSGVLMRAGIEYARSHHKAKPTDQERAARFRTGTMIAFLALIPLRRTTFAMLEIGSSVQVDADRILIAASSSMMKSGISWEAEVPEMILPLLRNYVDVVRPWLMRKSPESHQFLWVNDRGLPFDLSHISNRVAWATKEIFGVRVSSHLFRDAAATTLARNSPDSTKLIAPLLAHTSQETSERHYIHANSIDAGRAYASILDAKRRRG